MKIEKKKLKLEIFDDQYSVISDEKEVDILKASKIVDTLMREIADKSSLSDINKIAVLAALRVSSRLVDLENSLCVKQKEFVTMIEKRALSSSF